MKNHDFKLILPFIEEEIQYTATRGSGPGGQNVNKVNTRVELRFNVNQSRCLSEEQKQMVLSKLGRRINKEGELVMSSVTERTQLRNKEKVKERFLNLLSSSLTARKPRKATRPTLSSRIEKAKTKTRLSEKKILRRKPGQTEI